MVRAFPGRWELGYISRHQILHVLQYHSDRNRLILTTRNCLSAAGLTPEVGNLLGVGLDCWVSPSRGRPGELNPLPSWPPPIHALAFALTPVFVCNSSIVLP